MTATTPLATLTTTRTDSGLRGAIAAEWMKLRSLRSTLWFVLGSVASMVLISPFAAMTMTSNLKGVAGAEDSIDAASIGVSTISYFIIFILASLAMLSVTSEYSTGSITTTLSCVPDRRRVLLAKAAVTGAVSFVVGVVVAALGVLFGGTMLDEYAHYSGEIVFQVLATGVFLAAISVLTIGLSAVLRSAAGTIVVLFALFLVIPMLLQGIGEVVKSLDFLADIAEYFPSQAGAHFALNDTEPFGPFVGFLVVGAWAAAALWLGITTIRKRDA
ncbi:ABC transporter permease subunit [Streptomyces sp. NPDC048337]|uniref:ABC transporter permease subunit n=1 Tax=Streptomyces sp. NPDC048337 TaxID=3365535 RepID=UPI003714A2A2